MKIRSLLWLSIFELADTIDFSYLPADDLLLLLAHVEHRCVNRNDILENFLADWQGTLFTDELPVVLESVYALVLSCKALELVVDLADDPVQSQFDASSAPLGMLPKSLSQYLRTNLFISFLDKGVDEQGFFFGGPFFPHLFLELLLFDAIFALSGRSDNWHNNWGYRYRICKLAAEGVFFI